MSTNKTFNVELTRQELYLLWEAMHAEIYNQIEDTEEIINAGERLTKKRVKLHEENAELWIKISKILWPKKDATENYIDTFGLLDFEEEFPIFKETLVEKTYDVVLKVSRKKSEKEYTIHNVSGITPLNARIKAIEILTNKITDAFIKNSVGKLPIFDRSIYYNEIKQHVGFVSITQTT